MCDCFEKTTKLLKEKCTEKVKDEIGFQEVNSAGFVNRLFMTFDSEMNQKKSSPLYLPFEIKYTRKAKTTGNVRDYKKETSVLMTHCPFCGEKYGQ